MGREDKVRVTKEDINNNLKQLILLLITLIVVSLVGYFLLNTVSSLIVKSIILVGIVVLIILTLVRLNRYNKKVRVFVDLKNKKIDEVE